MQAEISEIFTPRVVIVENDENDAIILSRVLERAGLNVDTHWAKNISELLEIIDNGKADMVISDYNLQPDTALDVVQVAKHNNLGTPVIVVSHHIGEKAAVEVMKAGACDVVNKVDYKHLVASVSRELVEIDRIREREHLTTKLFDIDRERRDLAEALKQVKEAEATATSLLAQLNKVFESSPDGIRVIDRDFNVLRVNANYLTFTTCESSQSVTGKCFDFTPRSWCHSEKCILTRCLAGEEKIEEQIKMVDAQGQERQYVLQVSALKGPDGQVDGIVENIKDVTQWQQMQRQVMHAQKMESIGQLAAGIAHEINTPTQFVGDNISFLRDGFRDMIELLTVYEKTCEEVQSGNVSQNLWDRLSQSREAADVDYLMEEIPQAISQSAEGIERISSIVKAMKEFSHPGSEDAELFNVNQNIQNTVTVARNEWKYVSRVDLELGFKLPLVRGYPGEFNQTILNMIVNAAHAIEAKSAKMSDWKGTISIRTYVKMGYVVIEIIDNGSGIPKAILNRIYDPFFTTKGVGKGTGQGLAIAHSSIVDKHNGTIDVTSVEGEGTTFVISLPSVELEKSKEPPK
ncbi:MAG: PAS domain-containing protein [Deltaproteobacteria bacterium]|nr:PAS domain-containing protein [Deltaproteobacteria bacterium]